MTFKLKEKLDIIKDEIDFESGKLKRFLMQGFMGYPAWTRASFWFVFGNVAFAIAQSYLGGV